MDNALSMSDGLKPPLYFQSNESAITFPPPQPLMPVGPFSHSTTAAPIIDPNVNATTYQPSAPPLTISPSARLMLYAHLVLRALNLNVGTGADIPFGLRRLINYQNAHLLSIHELSALQRLAEALSPLRFEGSILINDESIAVDEGFRFVPCHMVCLEIDEF